MCPVGAALPDAPSQTMSDTTPIANPDKETIRRILREARVIAVVGLADRPEMPSYQVAQYLQRQGYRIVPVNPWAGAVLGEQGYPDLVSIPFPVDLVDIFRRSEHVGPHVDDAIRKGAPVVWMQMGIRNEEAARRAIAAGITVVMDRCTKIDHAVLLGR